MFKDHVWIPIEYKNEYSDFAVNGLRLHFSDAEISERLRRNCISFCKWLRKKYWFPIRCNIRFEFFSFYKDHKDSKKGAASIFYFPKIDKQNCIRVYPDIRTAVSKFEKEAETHGEEEALYWYYEQIVHELTHYFQWCFFETEKRSKRSLEIEANKWADYLVNMYIKESRK